MTSDIEKKAQVLKAMAHPSRLAIVEALAEGELCVCDLQKRVGSDLSTVSKHLSLMKKAGVLADRREGTMVIYRLRCPCVLRFLDCLEPMIRERGTGSQEEAEPPGSGVLRPRLVSVIGDSAK